MLAGITGIRQPIWVLGVALFASVDDVRLSTIVFHGFDALASLQDQRQGNAFPSRDTGVDDGKDRLAKARASRNGSRPFGEGVVLPLHGGGGRVDRKANNGIAIEVGTHQIDLGRHLALTIVKRNGKGRWINGIGDGIKFDKEAPEEKIFLSLEAPCQDRYG